MALIELSELIDGDKLRAAHVSMQTKRMAILRKNELLKRSLLKHFRIKKVYRAYSPDNPEQVTELYERYRDRLSQLDEVTSLASVNEIFEFSNEFRLIHSLDYCQPSSIASRLYQKAYRCERYAGANVRIEMFKLVWYVEPNSHEFRKLFNHECYQQIMHAEQIQEIQEITSKLQSTQTGRYLTEKQMLKILYRMECVRQRISDVRLAFIKTIDKHAEIDNVINQYSHTHGILYHVILSRNQSWPNRWRIWAAVCAWSTLSSCAPNGRA